MEEIDRKSIMQSFLINIWHISDKAYQRRVWIEARGPECDDFDETADFFLHHASMILEDYKSYGLTNHQYQLLKNFYDEFDAFPYSTKMEFFPQDIIDTPEWTKITEMAKEVLKTFNWKMPESSHDSLAN